MLQICTAKDWNIWAAKMRAFTSRHYVQYVTIQQGDGSWEKFA
jgi:hypothetical protein